MVGLDVIVGFVVALAFGNLVLVLGHPRPICAIARPNAWPSEALW